MNIRTYVLAITCIFALLSTSFGEEGATPPAADEQGSAPSVTSPQGSSPAAGEQNASSSASGQEEASPSATSPQGSPPAVDAHAVGQQEATPPVEGEGSQVSAPPVEGAQEAAPPVASQEATPSVEGPEFAAPPAAPQEPSPFVMSPQGSSPLTLKESIEIALQKSPTLQAAQGAIKEAKYRRLGTVSDFLPHVSTQYSYTRLDKAPTSSILGPTVTVGTKDNYNWTSTATQPVFTGGALINNYLLAKIGVDLARVEFERTRLDLALQVKEAYYSVLNAEKGLEVAEQAVAQLDAHYTVAQAFFDVGMIAKNDLLQTEVQLAQSRQDLIKAQNGLEVSRAVFNTLLRRGLNESVKLGEPLEYRPMTINVDLLTDEAYRERPELKAAGLQIQSAKKGVGLAASKLFPQVSIVFNYERVGDEPSVNGSRYISDADSWNVMGVAQWNVWDWGKAWWGVGENKAKVFQAKCALEEVKDAVRLDVMKASLSVEEARKSIQVAETAVSQAEENFRINEERYKGQVATSTDVLDALTRQTQARTNYYTALSAYNVAKASLQRAIGGM
jgi:outer membrane protein